MRGAEAQGSEKGAKDRQECSLFVCELYSNSNVFTRLLFTRYKARLNIHVGRTGIEIVYLRSLLVTHYAVTRLP